ncbi:MAG TPA: hypothetical protein VMU57_00980 [Edaphobacter sp.]|uniref:hypothetical protein n=1 Tax=Edaphobacter sp. TaxID=1934404 RepID=UPI002C3FED7F|nr:hypothetical protein [Edaphobacter sp.]HUZ93465.1 hypothetical protein [Edaphobacter sp.]
MNPDGMSYLDVGDQYWKGNWHAALNSYWSPLYTWLTGLVFRIARPSMRWEFPEVHLLNFIIFVATLFCFEFFWRELLEWRDETSGTGASRKYAWCIGYLLFTYVHFVIHPLSLVTPDLLVDALVYVISGMMLRFVAAQVNAASAVLFGVLVGVGYLAKAAMLPFGLLVFVVMFAVAWKRRAGKCWVGIAVLGFLLISGSFISALSWNNHRFTFGDSGKMNVAWFVNGFLEQRQWQDGGTTHTQFQHPTRKLLDSPKVYEFAVPVAGTYPVWYDPTYWNAGIDTRMHPLKEMLAFRRNMLDLSEYVFLRTGFVTAALLLMFLLSDRRKESRRRLLSLWPIIVPAVAVFLMYAMVFLEPRYFSGDTVILWGAVMASTSIEDEEQGEKLSQAASLALATMVFCLLLPVLISSHRKDEQFGEQVALAEQLHSMGMKKGDHVALMGDGMTAYWAQLDKVEIVAELPQSSQAGDSEATFWNASQDRERSILNMLEGTGAEEVIANAPPKLMPHGWSRISNTGYAVYFFR